MVIAKMRKVQSVDLYDQKEAVLEQLQDFQGVELLSSENIMILKKRRCFDTGSRTVWRRNGEPVWSSQLELKFLEEYVPKRNAGTTAATNQKYTLQELAETATPILGKNYAKPFVNKTNVFAWLIKKNAMY